MTCRREATAPHTPSAAHAAPPTSAPVTTRAIPPAGTHGGDGERVAAALGIDPADLLDLSASMNPVAADPVPIIRRHLRAGLDRYPTPDRAHAALAEVMGVAPERLLLTNGGAEAIALVADVLGGWVIEPEFALYPRRASPVGSTVLDGRGSVPRWRSNPHSPSGILARPDERSEVWDEAFYPLAAGRWTRGDVGAVVVGSLTKLLAAPGLRIGYIVADPELLADCRRRQPGWSVNGLVCAALPDLLATVDLARSVRGISELREELVGLLSSHGIPVRPSQANWVLADRPGLREALAPHGVLVRDCTSFGMPGVARIAVPTAEGLARLEAALTRIDGYPPAAGASR